MTPTESTTTHQLQVTRTLAASRDAVWQAWTDPKTMAKWLRPGPDFEPFDTEIDLRVGGRYRHGMRHTEKGEEHIATGVYREIKPKDRLAFTWAWEGSQGDGATETLVTIELRDTGDAGDGTELILTHSLFPTDSMRDHHEQGWGGCLGQLEQFLTAS
jgi:uncharacterized protein YndB with AHSA1/START domain